MAVSKRTRFEVLRRDNNTCRYCHATDTPLTIDHVIPTALGGTDDPSNLAAACKDCNAGKTSSSPDAATVEQVSNDAARWAAAMKLAAERIAANKAETDGRLKPWFDEWWMRSGPGWAYKLPSDAGDVLRKYLATGMPIEVLVDAARVALRAHEIDQRFRYFQGVANNMLAELQRDAAALLATESGSSDYVCSACRYKHPAGQCGFWTGWRVGYVDCAITNPDTENGGPGHPDHYQMMALSRVVDASAHADWAERGEELYPLYTGRAN